MNCVRSIRAGNAAGTQANKRTHNTAYEHFCTEYMFDPYPSSNWQLVQFAQYLYAEHKKPETVENYVSSIRTLHRMAGFTKLEAGDIFFNLMVKGLKRQCTHPVKQAQPMTHSVLMLLFEKVNFNNELEAVAWTATLVGFNLVLRVSNLGPPTRKDFDPSMNLIRADYQVTKGVPALGIRWSKTNQYRNRVNWAPLIALQQREICPRWWVKRMLQLILAEQHEPLFLIREKDNRHPLTSGQVRRLLKKWCKDAAVEPKQYTPNCLCRGGLNWVHDAQLTGETLQVLGDWRTQTYQKYPDIDFNVRLKSGEKMAEYLDNQF